MLENRTFSVAMKKYQDIREHSLELTEVTRNFYGKLIGSFPPFDPREKVERLLQGAIDTHFHAGPHVFTVCRSEIEYGLRATEAGMQAIFDKGSTTPTARSALLVQEIVNQWAKERNKRPCRIMGGVVLCYQVGGLNVEAVRNAAQFGGKFVWMPPFDCSHHRRLMGTSSKLGHGIDMLDENDEVVEELKDIFRVIAEFDMVLVCTHQSTKERLIMVDTARELGVKRILLVHVFQPTTKLDIEQMKLFIDKGCYLEHCFFDLSPVAWPWEETLQAFREIGTDRFVIASDLGNWRKPDPIDMYKITIGLLLEYGIPEADVAKMVRLNAEKLIWGDP